MRLSICGTIGGLLTGVAYLWLANIYRYNGEEERFLRTLEEALTIEDAGLAHVNVLIELADHYRLKKDWETALFYAQQAAGSYAGHGLLCLARCYEAMGDLDQAGQWMERLGKRYPESAHVWYAWCRIHGRGNVEDAKRLCEAHGFAKPISMVVTTSKTALG